MKKYILVVILKCTDSRFSCSLTFKLRGCACKDLKMKTQDSIFFLLLLFLGQTAQVDIAIKENIGH